MPALKYYILGDIDASLARRPKSTVCFFNILEKKMTGGETARFCPYLDKRELFVKVGARFPRPQMMNIQC